MLDVRPLLNNGSGCEGETVPPDSLEKGKKTARENGGSSLKMERTKTYREATRHRHSIV